MNFAPNSDVCENVLKVTGHIFSFALFMALIGAWIITRPILILSDQVAWVVRQRTGRAGTQGRGREEDLCQAARSLPGGNKASA